jgi:tetratricopeptide (TPR) repeat protein
MPNIFDRISFWSLFLVIVLLPIFFLPFTSIPVELSKGLLLVVGLVSSVIFYAIARFSDGKIILPRSKVLLSALVLLVILLISTLVSSSPKVSFFGTMFDFGSYAFFLAAFLMMFMSSLILRTPKNAKTVLLGLLLSSTVLFIFQGLRFFAPGALTLGILNGKTDNLLGSWYTYGLFAGFFSVLSLFVLEFLPIMQRAKYILGSFLVLALLTVAVVNLSLIWVLVGIFALIIFIYKISFSFKPQVEGESKPPFPIVSFSVFMFSFLFLISNSLGAFLPSKIGLNNVDVSPSFSATSGVAKQVLAKHPVLGLGPNRFAEAWTLYKPVDINKSQFWNTSFDFGRGLFPTFFATTGALGILAWLGFLGMFLYVGLKSLLSNIKNSVNLEMSGFFLASLFLFISFFFYSAGPALFLTALAFAGIFIGLYSASKENGEMTVVFSNNPSKSFMFLCALIVVMLASAAAGFKYIERFVSVPYFRTALFASDVKVAEPAIIKALNLHQNDLYWRMDSQVNLFHFNELASSNKNPTLTEQEKAALQNALARTVAAANEAVKQNPNNYLNPQMLGFVYQSVGQLGVKDAFKNAIVAYQNAATLNPLNPGIKLSLARVYFADGKVKEAEAAATEAVNLKSDYTDALVALSQIKNNQGNNNEAVTFAQAALSYVQSALVLSPQDQNLLQQNKDLNTYINTLKNSSTPSASTVTAPTEDTTDEDTDAPKTEVKP